MKILLVIVISFLFGNVLYLNWVILGNKQTAVSPITETKPTPITTISQTAQVCSQSCMTAIAQATKSATTSQQATNQTQTPIATPQEFIVPLGNASFTSTTMATIPGLQVYLNPSNYSNITRVTFEASIFVPTGNETVNIQLFNQTAGHPVWNSQMFFAGGSTTQLLISQPITLDPGNNLYQVQMQTQLTYPANINQAIIRIETN